MMDVNYFLDDAQNSRQDQFELDFADVITCFDLFQTTLVTKDGRTLVINWTDAGFFKDYKVLPEITTNISQAKFLSCHIISMLRHMDVDGETMQYIIKSVGMEDQMLRQLMMTQPINDVEYNWEVRRNQ